MARKGKKGKKARGSRVTLTPSQVAQLIRLLRILLVLLQARGFSKKMKRSLAISESATRESVLKGKKRKRKGPPKGRVPPHLRKYLFKKGHRPVGKK